MATRIGLTALTRSMLVEFVPDTLSVFVVWDFSTGHDAEISPVLTVTKPAPPVLARPPGLMQPQRGNHNRPLPQFSKRAIGLALVLYSLVIDGQGSDSFVGILGRWPRKKDAAQGRIFVHVLAQLIQVDSCNHCRFLLFVFSLTAVMSCSRGNSAASDRICQGGTNPAAQAALASSIPLEFGQKHFIIFVVRHFATGNNADIAPTLTAMESLAGPGAPAAADAFAAVRPAMRVTPASLASNNFVRLALCHDSFLSLFPCTLRHGEGRADKEIRIRLAGDDCVAAHKDRCSL